jgi:hypothetical protein
MQEGGQRLPKADISTSLWEITEQMELWHIFYNLYN